VDLNTMRRTASDRARAEERRLLLEQRSTCDDDPDDRDR